MATILRFSWKLIKSCPGLVTAYILLNFISQSAVPQAIALIYGRITDAISTGAEPAPPGMAAKPAGWLTGIFWVWIVITFGGIALAIVCKAAAAAMDGRMKIYIRSHLFDEILRQSPDFYQENDAGRLNLMLNQIGVQAQQALRSIVIDPSLQLIGILTASILIAFQLRRIGGVGWEVMAVVIVLGGLPTWIISRKGRHSVEKVNADIQNQRFKLGTLENGVVSSPEEIQTLGAEAVFARKHSNTLEELRRNEIKQSVVMESVNVGLQIPGKLALAMVIFLALFHANKITARPGVFVTLIALVPQVTDPFRAIASIGILASASWPAIVTVLDLLKPHPPEPDETAQTIETASTHLESRNVRFKYRSRAERVFDGLSFSVSPGGITGLVARMGQGKTTFFRLVLRFYDPESGEIVLGGVHLHILSAKTVRQSVAMISQFPAFFHDSLAENFRVAQPTATAAQMREVCERTGIWPILEKDYGTDPLENPFAAGLKLSGGQKKLFALTRCLLRDPKVLLLDEPTTGMDNLEKFPLIPVIRKACLGKTVVVVDHDLPWMVQFCDQIVVLDNGRVVQTGTPAELLEIDGLFKELHDAAFATPTPVRSTPPDVKPVNFAAGRPISS